MDKRRKITEDRVCIDCSTNVSSKWYYKITGDPTSGFICLLCYRKIYNVKNKEKIKIFKDDYNKQYQIDNREKLNAYRLVWKANDRKKNKEKASLQDHRYNCTLRARYHHAKSAAKRRNIFWGLSLEQFQSLITQKCFYCCGELPETTGGLDRVDNSKAIGYTLDNVLPCCTTCNRIRGDVLTVEEMKIAMKAILEFRNKNNLSEVI